MRPFDDENWLNAKRVARELDKVLDATGPRRVAVARAAGELRLSTRRIYMLLARYRRERTVTSLRSRNGAARRKRLDALTQPLLRRVTSRARLENESKPRSRNHKDGAGAANLHSLLAAYGAVGARRELRMRGDSSFYASSAVSSSSASSNSISLSKI